MKIRYAFLTLLILASPLRAASVAEDLFHQAVVRESVERDPEGAIRLYQYTLEQPDVTPPIRAEARLRMGMCFEKLEKLQQAEEVYQDILANPSDVPPSILQQAYNNQRRVKAERLAVGGNSATMQYVRRFVPTRFSLLVGPSLVASSHATPALPLSVGLRFRTTADKKALGWFVEARGTIGSSEIAHQSRTFDSQGVDHASLTFNNQVSLGVIRELPHGQQRVAIPEAGTGLSFTGSKIHFVNTSSGSSGDVTERLWRPYLETGVHLLPDHVISILLNAQYTVDPYPKSVDIADPAHSQTFSFPSSQWNVGALLQMKIGYRIWALEPKS